jgi:hypothetical protein
MMMAMMNPGNEAVPSQNQGVLVPVFLIERPELC